MSELLNDVTFFLITMKMSLLTNLNEKLRNYAKQKSLTCPKHRRKNTFLLYGYNSTHALIGCFFVMIGHFLLVMT